MELGFWILIAVLIVRWFSLKGHLRKVDLRIAQLTARLYALETENARLRKDESAPPLPSGPVAVQVLTEMAPADSVPSADPPRKANDDKPSPDKTRDHDWETLVGGNWLNKLGVLVLVVGIALFLGYSLTYLGPAGKVAIGLATGGSLLAAGVALARKTAWRTFGYGLAGGGWAALFFTVFAMHGLPAARLIESPAVAAVLLLGVTAAMVAHTLLYRKEVVTALAYFIGFVGLNLHPLTGYSVLAVTLLGLALIGTAHRFGWFRLAAAGVVLTYASFAVRYEGAVYEVYGQTLPWLYWIIFESFDFINLRRRISPAFFAINAAGFLAASLVLETNRGQFLLAAGVAYVLSAWLRSRLIPQTETARAPLFAGGFESAIALAAALLAGSAIQQLSGLTMTAALLAEAQSLVVAGVLFRKRFLVTLGGWFHTLPFFRMVLVNFESPLRVTWLQFRVRDWSGLALLMAAVFYANRAWTGSGRPYTFAGSFLLASIVMQNFGDNWVAVALGLGGLVSLAIGRSRGARDLRWQSYLIAIVVFGRTLWVNLESQAMPERLITAVLVVLILYAQQLLALRDLSLKWECRARPVLSILATFLLTALLVKEVEGRVLTVAWGIEGALILTLGFVLKERVFRLSGLTLFALCAGKLFFYDLRQLDTLSRILSFIGLGILLLGASWIYTRFREQIRRML